MARGFLASALVSVVAVVSLSAGCGPKKGGGSPDAGDGADASCSADLQTDPDNCGACNVKCSVGSQCFDGKCAGYVIHKPASVAWVDACKLPGAQTVLQNAAGSSKWTGTPEPIPMGFTFTFYGTPYTQVWIGNQGTMGLGAYPQAANGALGCPLPDSGGYAAVMAFGDGNLELSSNAVCYANDGAAPSRRFVVTWEKATLSEDQGSVVTFSAILNETSNAIDFVYETAMQGTGGGAFVDGVSALVGLQADAMGSAYTQVAGCGQEIYANAPYAIHLTPAM